MGDSLREQLEAAYDAQESADPGLVAAEGEEQPAGEPLAQEQDAGREDAGGDRGGDGVREESSSAAQRARDEQGRFAPKDKSQTKAPREVATTKTAVPGAAQSSTSGQAMPTAGGDSSSATPVPAVKAPQSWTPGEREHFAKAPPEVQAAINRRETEMARALNETAHERRYAQEMRQTLQPYEQFAQSLGTNATALTKQALQVALQISTAPAHAAAQVLANLVRSRPDMSVELLAQALDAQPQQSQAAQPPMDPRAIAAQVEQQVFQRLQAQREQAANQSATKQVEAFAADPKHKYFEDVWPDMAGLIDAAKARGVEMSLEEAYNRAVRANPETWAIVQKQEQEQQGAAKAQQASTQRSRAAAVSVRSSPAANPANGASRKGLRAALETAWDEQTSRR